jgi:AraC-like DNA-binding protein
MSSPAIIKLDIWSVLLLGSAFLGYFLSVILITHKKRNSGANLSLGLLILEVALTLTEYLLIRSGYYFYDSFHQIIFVTTPLTFLKGPLYYLKLPELAKNVSISTNHLSQLLNQELGQNFFDFINWYRVQEAQRRLADSQCKHLTLLAIAYETGFSNKTSFNRVFKKHTGMTPSQFVKKNRQGGSSPSSPATAYAKQN